MGKCLFMRKGETHSAPVNGILASKLAVGSSVYLNENGSPVEYLVVHNGLPSSMYDASCDDLWLLRKTSHSNRVWDSSNNDYANSDIHTWLNSGFLDLFDTDTKNIIKQSKIPYFKGVGSSGSVTSGSNGLSVKVFLLSGYEFGFGTAGLQSFPADGAPLEGANSSIGVNDNLWSRTPRGQYGGYVGDISNVWFFDPNYAGMSYTYYNDTLGVRPALIIPSNAIFDADTMILKGVA